MLHFTVFSSKFCPMYDQQEVSHTTWSHTCGPIPHGVCDLQKVGKFTFSDKIVAFILYSKGRECYITQWALYSYTTWIKKVGDTDIFSIIELDPTNDRLFVTLSLHLPQSFDS